MEQSGEYRIPAPRERVWQALNDAAVLERCLDGCRAMTPVGDGGFEAIVAAKVGPVKAVFTAAICLRDVIAPQSYRLDVEVKSGVAGFAKGTAAVELEEAEAGAGDETLLRYRIEGGIGGKLAQIGSRLVDGAARKMARRFFERFVENFAGEEREALVPRPKDNRETEG